MSDDCVVCGKWPERDRWALREMIDALPLDEEPICDATVRLAHTRNIPCGGYLPLK